MKFYLFFILFLFDFATAYTQNNNWSFQFNYLPGKLFKHSDKMLFNPNGLSQFAEFNIQYQTKGEKAWQQFYKCPKLGLGFRYLHFGSPSQILGSGYSVSPFIDFSLKEFNNSSLRFKISCGLAYLEKTYHLKNNPLNTAIGSHWNNLTSFQLVYEWRIHNSNLLSAGICLSHLSNGAFKAPNLGYNFISAALGYSFQLKAFAKDSKSVADLDVKPSKGSAYSLETQYGISLKEGIIPGGPKFLIQWYFFDIGYQYNPFKSFRIAAEIENNNIDSYFASYSEVKPNKKSAGKDDWSINTYLAHQWLFGPVALSFRVGYEFNRAKTIEYSPFISKLDLYYVVPFHFLQNIKPYVGFSLKAHLDTAAYIGILGGIRFYKMNRTNSEIDTFTY